MFRNKIVIAIKVSFRSCSFNVVRYLRSVYFQVKSKTDFRDFNGIIEQSTNSHYPYSQPCVLVGNKIRECFLRKLFDRFMRARVIKKIYKIYKGLCIRRYAYDSDSFLANA